MNLHVVLKLVPDTVEELDLADDGRSLAVEALRFKPSDPDDHALEQALLLKERQGGRITVLALDTPEVDDALFAALARGADRVVKLTGGPVCRSSREAAWHCADWLQAHGALDADSLVLLRSQAVDDLDGEVGAYLAHRLGLPYVCVVTGVEPRDGRLTVTKEFAGGLRGQFSLPSPAVLGIQSAAKPPRYVPIAKVRQAMKSAKIETVPIDTLTDLPRLAIERMYKPEPTGRAQMLEGAPDEVAGRLVELLAERRLI